jgi:hypothetical protein
VDPGVVVAKDDVLGVNLFRMLMVDIEKEGQTCAKSVIDKSEFGLWCFLGRLIRL